MPPFAQDELLHTGLLVLNVALALGALTLSGKITYAASAAGGAGAAELIATSLCVYVGNACWIAVFCVGYCSSI